MLDVPSERAYYDGTMARAFPTLRAGTPKATTKALSWTGENRVENLLALGSLLLFSPLYTTLSWSLAAFAHDLILYLTLWPLY